MGLTEEGGDAVFGAAVPEVVDPRVLMAGAVVLWCCGLDLSETRNNRVDFDEGREEWRGERENEAQAAPVNHSCHSSSRDTGYAS